MRILSTFMALFTIWNFLVKPTTNLQGEYINEDAKIVIQNDTLYLIVNQGTIPVYASDTLAECSIKNIDKNWYEINSFDSRGKVHKSFTIIQDEDCSIKDSICFTVLTSSKYEVLEADLFYSSNSNRSCWNLFPIINGEGHVAIAREQLKSLYHLSICPRYPMYDFESLSFNGIAVETFLVDEVDINKTNNVIFNIAAIDDSYFQKYNVFHEYINVTHDYLLWRGKKYRRQ